MKIRTIRCFLAMMLVAVFITGIIPWGIISAEALTRITDSASVTASDYTQSATLASKLSALFDGTAKIVYNNSSYSNALGYPLGSKAFNANNQFWIKTSYGVEASGWQCFIYGNAVYNYLFNDIPERGSWQVSETLASARSFSSGTDIYSLFVSKEVLTGAYIRTTANSDGSYSNSGHSMIVLSYDSTGITTLCANGDGLGTVQVYEYTWAEFYTTRFSNQGRILDTLVQPTKAKYYQMYPNGGITTQSWMKSYNPNSDSRLTPSVIQSFLTSYNGSLDNYITSNGQTKVVVGSSYLDMGFDNYFSYSNSLMESHINNKATAVTLSPAQILYYACIENDCNVAYMLAKLQQEQSLITQSATQGKLDCAVGYLSNNGAGQKFCGYFGQVIAATYQNYVYAYTNGYSMQQAYEKYTPPTDPSNMTYTTFLTLYNSYASKLDSLLGYNPGVTVTAPTITSPTDEYYSNSQGTHYTAGQSLTFSWAAGNNASYYKYSVKRISGYPNPGDNEPAAGEILHNGDIVYSPQSITIPASYLTAGYWYKFAVGAYASEENYRWGSFVYVYIEDSSVSVPVITNPIDEYYSGTQGSHYKAGQSISFSWTASTNANYYIYSIKRLAGSPNPGDNEPANGTPHADGVSINTNSTITVPASYMTAGSWYKFAVGAYNTESNFKWAKYVYIYLPEQEAQQVQMPQISSNAVAGGNRITITCATSGASIYYTTNGSTPTTGSTLYTSPFTINASMTIKAIAVKSDMTNSPVATRYIEVAQQQVVMPQISVSDAANGKRVTITCATTDAEIYYTTDAVSWQRYSAAFIVTQSCTVQARATKSGMIDSDVAMQTVTVAANTYSVRFLDWDNSVLNVQTVAHGQSAVEPTTPTRLHYIFIGWDKTFDNITCDLDIKALYKIDTTTPPPADAPIVRVSNVQAAAGQVATVTLSLANNPGISFLRIRLTYDTSVLTLQNAQNGEVLGTFENGLNLMWDAEKDSNINGTLVTLVFKVSENATDGEYSISADVKECFNEDSEVISVYTSMGAITISSIMYGDVNGDGVIDGRDIIMLRKYLAAYDDETGTSSVTVSIGADVNGDKKIDGRDLILLRKYLAAYNDETGTSTVPLGPQK